MTYLSLQDGIYQALIGSTVFHAIAEALELASSEGHTITFQFNEVTVTVAHDSDANLIYRDWDRAMNGYIDKNVGPYPKPVLTDEEVASDARIEAENQLRRQVQYDEQQAKEQAQRQQVDSILADAPTIELSDEKTWREFKAKNRDCYGAGVIAYAQRWARLMQVEIAAGKKLEDIAEDTSFLADTDGITGFMYGCAVTTLAQCWKHGEQLRRWHNHDTQMGTEGDEANENGGVLNPAVIILSKKD